VIKIHEAFKDAGYQLRIEPYLLDASKMGVPQKRKRVFFIALRNDLAEDFMEQVDFFQRAPKLELTFNEKPITYGEIKSEHGDEAGITDYIKERMAIRIPEDKSIGDINMRVYGKLSMFNQMIVFDKKVIPTITSGATMYRDCDSLTVPPKDYQLAGSYPLDYDFSPVGKTRSATQYLVGMSVPPVMVARIATEIHHQWLQLINK
jgi:DNA (cytosine-5)-methyltransferase 1